jgi:chromosome partitioning protein
MRKIVIVNSKGGSGKTTVAVNLAAALAVHGDTPAILDLDPQGSSIRWLKQRPEDRVPVAGIAGYRNQGKATRTFQLTPPKDCTALIVDTPAGLDRHGLEAATRGADAILMPVMSSDIDIHAATHCIADLLLGSRGAQNQKRIGIIANRLKTNSRGSQRLQVFLQNFDIPSIATLRDSVNYTQGAELGIGIHELPAWQTRKDLEAWEAILNWVQGESKCYDSNPNMPLRVGLSGAVRVALGRHQRVS